MKNDNDWKSVPSEGRDGRLFDNQAKEQRELSPTSGTFERPNGKEGQELRDIYKPTDKN